MRVLLIGSGAREHALGWKLAQSPKVSELWSLPGNPGLAELGPVVEGVDPTEVGAVAAVAAGRDIDLVVVGPEAPLACGLIDALAHRGVAAFGPSRAAARLEASKSFAKQVMDAAAVPTARWWSFTEAGPALDHLGRHPGPYVVKADGLAAGKGVVVTSSPEVAAGWVHRCLGGGFGKAGATVVIEEFLEGPELSVFAVCAGEQAVALEPARDYKRLSDGDTGPNTGGMGSYSPVDLPPGLVQHVLDTVIRPVLRQMAAGGHPYTGFLYAGLVLTAEGPQVLEFNCRLGDPESQVVIPRLQTDLVEIVEAALSGRLESLQLQWSPEAAVNVVLATQGYPDHPRLGDPISGLDRAEALVFHAGTARAGKRLVTAGGRVLSVVGRGPTVAAARRQAYAAVDRIGFAGRQFRRDIADPTRMT